MALKVLHLSTSDANGGAARAAYSLHRALLSHGIASRMRVGIKRTDDPTVSQGNSSRFVLSSLLDRQLWRIQKSPRTTWRSPARFSSIDASEVNESGADVVNLHWVTDGFISIEEIGKIEIPVVWSMYDLWPFSGTEHYGNIDSQRWCDGYTRQNRPIDESGFDLDRWTFNRKAKSWLENAREFHMIPASDWLKSATHQSLLMTKWPITKIPHVVNTDVFSPMDQQLARKQLEFPQRGLNVLFLASAGISDRRKGWDILAPALHRVSCHLSNLNVIVVGPKPDLKNRQRASEESSAFIHWYGTVASDEELRTLYAAVDAVVVPSREDNLPLTALEALSVGCPTIASDIGGLREIGRDVENCYTTKPEDIDDLAEVLLEVLGSPGENRQRSSSADLWSPGAVGSKYAALYERVVRHSL